MTVYRLITKHSIEESIVRLHENKEQLARALLDDGGAVAELSVDELLSLVGQSVAQSA